MEQFRRVVTALAILAFLAFMYFLCTTGTGCRSEEEKYFNLKYPECVVEIVERTNINTKVRITCPGQDPEIVKVRSK